MGIEIQGGNMNFKIDSKQESSKNFSFLVILLITVTGALSTSCAPKKSSSDQIYSNSPTSSSNILGGVLADAQFQNTTGVVGLLIFSTDMLGKEHQSICTGTLIDKKVVLTAAHCIADPGLTNVIVIFDQDFSKITESRLRFALTGRVHENYLAEVNHADSQSITANWNDLALLGLNEDAPADVTLAKLAPAATNIKKGQELTLSGYGITNAIIRKIAKGKNGKPLVDLKGQPVIQELAGQGDGVLRKVDGILVSQVINDSKELLLDQKKLKGACHGDSGGPAYMKDADGSMVQVGVTSRGLEALGNCNVSAVYTSVSAHADWINSSKDSLLLAIDEILKSEAAQANAAESAQQPAEPVMPEIGS
jgi:secreted trypsin-like serine protease